MAKTYSSFRSDLLAGHRSVVDEVSHFLTAIDQNNHLNAFLEVFAEEALNRAREIDARIAAGDVRKLSGCVVAIKDNIAYANHRLGAASRMLEGFESLFSATTVERMLAEDAIVIGRVNCDEFAMGGSNENSYYGPVKNPIQPDRVPGGSSGGSAAAVSAGLCHVALGSDTGGSIRQPASFCGVVGFKPTYGTVSRNGLIAFASSFDQIGPLCHTVEDAALVMAVIHGPDPMDSTTSPKAKDFTLHAVSQGGLRWGFLDACIDHAGLDAEIASELQGLKSQLTNAGETVTSASFTLLEAGVPAYYVLTTAEASSNLARYDGIHYGYRSPAATDLGSTYIKSRSEGFGAEVKRRILLGTFVLSSGYYDAYYSQAQRVRRLIRNEMERALNDSDVLVLPTTPTPAFKLGAHSKDPVAMYLEDIFTVQANLTGFPAISLPLGKHSSGLPYGVQLVARANADAELLRAAQFLMNSAL